MHDAQARVEGGLQIRAATPTDRPQILAVVRAAFATGGRDGEEEVDIVRTTWLREAVPAGLELVAVDGTEVVGHVMGARGRLGEREVIGLAPLAVAPARQRHGIGSALVNELLARAAAAGWPLVALLGSTGYYSRFGFEPAGRFGIAYRAVGEDNPDFQVRRLPGFDESWRGDFVYCWELPSALEG